MYILYIIYAISLKTANSVFNIKYEILLFLCILENPINKYLLITVDWDSVRILIFNFPGAIYHSQINWWIYCQNNQ